MESHEAVSIILEKLNWKPDDLVKSTRGKSPSVTKEQLVSAIINYSTYHCICTNLGIGEQTLHRLLKTFLVPLFGNRKGGGDTWKLALLCFANLQYCGNCGELLHYNSFTKDNSRHNNLDRICLKCKVVVNKDYYEGNKETYHKKYYQTNHEDYVYRNAARRAQKILATPSWANRHKMLEIYRSRGKGEHVDHIVPLIHPLVCGLHNEFNLRVISAEENLRKSNKFEV